MTATATYIPLEKTLKHILEIPGLFAEVEKYMQQLESDSTGLSNIIQGNLWRSKYKSNNGAIILPLFLYYDDFEPGNALGSHAGKQSLGGVYVTMPFLPPHLSCKLDNILVTLLLYTKYRKECENLKIFGTVIKEINKLSTDGLELDLNGDKIKVYFRCVLVTGDNLATNSICGFVESFSAKRFCRICRATSEECKIMSLEDKQLLRTKENYTSDLFFLRKYMED